MSRVIGSFLTQGEPFCKPFSILKTIKFLVWSTLLLILWNHATAASAMRMELGLLPELAREATYKAMWLGEEGQSAGKFVSARKDSKCFQWRR